MTACFYLWRTATRLIAYVGAGTCRPKFDQAKTLFEQSPALHNWAGARGLYRA